MNPSSIAYMPFPRVPNEPMIPSEAASERKRHTEANDIVREDKAPARVRLKPGGQSVEKDW